MSAPDRPRATTGLPGCGGRIKESPEDFRVEEVPAYQPGGSGEHIYLWVEKRGRGTQEVADQLARVLGIPGRDVSYAGLKDREAVTAQYFCMPAKVEPKLTGLAELPGVKVHSWKRHGNKLRTGHLLGNTFELRVRGVTDAGAADAKLKRLSQVGLPNYFGDQRFGAAQDNARWGKALLLGQRLEKKPDRFQRKLFLSAFQSQLFNRALEQRLAEGTWDRPLLGDVLRKAETGGMFVCTEPDVDAARAAAFEVSPAGPLFGPKMVPAQGEVAERESRLLSEEGVTPDDFKRGGGETEGGRRPYRVMLKELTWSAEGDVLHLRFFLPKGSYATEVLAELIA